MATEIVSTIDIDASPGVVWAVLAETAAYAEWNPFVRELRGDLVEGGRLRVRIGAPGRRAITLRPKVVRVAPEQELTWLGHLLVPGLFDGRHSFVLERRPDAGTRFTQVERFHGLLVPLTRRLLAATAKGFDAMNEALRDRSEARAISEPSEPLVARSAQTSASHANGSTSPSGADT